MQEHQLAVGMSTTLSWCGITYAATSTLLVVSTSRMTEAMISYIICTTSSIGVLTIIFQCMQLPDPPSSQYFSDPPALYTAPAPHKNSASWIERSNGVRCKAKSALICMLLFAGAWKPGECEERSIETPLDIIVNEWHRHRGGCHSRRQCQ
jgi:hypothetical protein